MKKYKIILFHFTKTWSLILGGFNSMDRVVNERLCILRNELEMGIPTQNGPNKGLWDVVFFQRLCGREAQRLCGREGGGIEATDKGLRPFSSNLDTDDDLYIQPWKVQTVNHNSAQLGPADRAVGWKKTADITDCSSSSSLVVIA